MLAAIANTKTQDASKPLAPPVNSGPEYPVAFSHDGPDWIAIFGVLLTGG